MNPVEEARPNDNVMVSTMKKRGRPKMDVMWPESNFTFDSLSVANDTLSSSSLRKKMRAELLVGGLVKTGTLKTAFGRPKNVYKKSSSTD